MITTNNLYPNLEIKSQIQYNVGGEPQLNVIFEKLNDTTFLSGLRGIYKDEPMNYIISIRGYPFLVDKLYNEVPETADDPIIIGGQPTGLEGKILKKLKGAYKIGEYTFIRYFNNFLDYAPYTSISCYLPYINSVNLPVNDVMGCTISFWYAIDTFTGVVTAYVWNDTRDYLILTANGELGIDVSLGGTNAYERFRNNFMNGASLVGGLFSDQISNMGNGGAVGFGVSQANSIIASNVERVTRGSIGEGRNALCCSQKVTIIFERPRVATELNTYDIFKGKPLLETKVLSTLTGYTEVEDIHIENIYTATKQELDEIENLLKSGVIL